MAFKQHIFLFVKFCANKSQFAGSVTFFSSVVFYLEGINLYDKPGEFEGQEQKTLLNEGQCQTITE